MRGLINGWWAGLVAITPFNQEDTVMIKIIPIPGLLLAAALAFVAAPADQVAASECGANRGNLCWQDQSCFNVLFYKQCTTKYKYYPGE